MSLRLSLKLSSTFLTFSITALPEDSEDTEQCESVSHMLLANIFVPVSEETRDDSSKERTMAVECKLHSEEASSVSLPERQDTPYEELTKVHFVIGKWDKTFFFFSC